MWDGARGTGGAYRDLYAREQTRIQRDLLSPFKTFTHGNKPEYSGTSYPILPPSAFVQRSLCKLVLKASLFFPTSSMETRSEEVCVYVLAHVRDVN